MTITPVPVRPAPASGPAGAAARDGRPSDPAGFAALVSREADRLAGGQRDDASGAGDVAAGGDAGTAPASVGDVPAGVVLPGVVAPEAAPAGAPGAASGDVPGVDAEVAPSGPGALTGTGPDAMAAEGGVASTAPEVGARTAGPAAQDTDADTHLVLRPGADASPVKGAAAVAADTPAQGPPGTQAADAVSAIGSTSGTAAEEAGPAQVPGAAPAATGPAGAGAPDVTGAPVNLGTAAATGAETAGASAPTGETARTTSALLEQVSPTLTRLASRGDGEHRMTLKIHPADLGEVHLTVTVRGERVDVDIAASAEARELLRDGLLQLRALLDPTGRGGGHLVFRDLPTAPTGQPVSAETAAGGDPGDRSGVGDGSAERHEGRGSHGDRTTVRTSAAPDSGGPAAPPPIRRGGSGARTVDLTI